MLYLISGTVTDVLGSMPLRVYPASPRLVKMILKDQGFTSAVADPEIAKVFSDILGMSIPVNTDPIEIKWAEDQVMLGTKVLDGSIRWMSVMATE